jgi:hypothetical protein
MFFGGHAYGDSETVIPTEPKGTPSAESDTAKATDSPLNSEAHT